MKKIIIPILIVFASFLLVSCGNKDEVANEIVHYYNKEWIPINDMKAKEMSGLPMKMNELAEEHKNDEVIALIKNEMLPIADEVLKRLEAVGAENSKVKKINDLQIEAEKFAKDTFKIIIAYYEGDDNVSERDLNQKEEKLDEKYQDIIDYQDKLIDQYKLEQTENEDEDSKFHKLKRAED